MRADPEARARDRLLLRLKTRGAQTAAALAEHLGVTPVAVRQHLQRLEAEGLVASRRAAPGGVGRPARLFEVAEAAEDRFPNAHAELTVDLIGAVRSAFGEDGLARVVAARTRRQERDYRARLPGREAPLAERVAALAALRREEGYMAECRKAEGGGWLLVENHCPICAAARACQGLCRDELGLFRRVLGRDARVERTEHLLAGARRCAYRVTPARARA